MSYRVSFRRYGALPAIVGLLNVGNAQNAPNAIARFEVASLKPSAPNNLGEGFSLNLYPGGRLRSINISLRHLIQIAYDLKQKSHVTGELSWLDSQKYDLEAKAGSAIGEPQARIMIQALLEERFKLKIHRESRQLPIYSLVLEKGGATGPNLHPSLNGDCGAMIEPQSVPSPAPGTPAAQSFLCLLVTSVAIERIWASWPLIYPWYLAAQYLTRRISREVLIWHLRGLPTKAWDNLPKATVLPMPLDHQSTLRFASNSD
jgi:hypothetical protein